MKIVKSLKESGLLIKCVSKTIKNQAKEEKGGFIVVMWHNSCKYVGKYVSRKF